MICPDGLPAAAWRTDAGAGDLGDVAGDVTLATTGGDFVLSERWTGCDGLVFLGVNPTDGYTGLLLDEPMKKLLTRGPEDAVYVLFPDGMGADGTVSSLEEIVATALDAADPAWADRVIVATDRASAAPGWVGELLGRYTYPVFGLDRAQVLREVGYLADPTTDWATVPWESLGYEVEHYHFEAARDAELSARDATVVTLWEDSVVGGEGWEGESGVVEVELPDAATMATFDRVDVELELACDGPWYSSCPEWDTSNYLWLCDEEDTTSCQEMARLITGYWRGGRWIVDGRGQLGALAGGGRRTFRYTAGMADIVTARLRFWSEGSGAVPAGRTQLWWDTSGFWDATFNASHVATVEIPASATRVELVALITGHGADAEGCGEFCESTHTFTVGDEDFVAVHDLTDDGCLEQIGVGALPNQGGTWTYGRSGWCPGMGVDPDVFDITAAVLPGGTVEVAYAATHEGRLYETDDGGNLDIGVWVTWYE